MKLILLLTVLFSVSFPSLTAQLENKNQTQEQVTISLNVIPTVRNAFYPIFTQFEQETGILVVPKFVNDFTFSQSMERWSEKETTPPDILFGHNGERLKALVEQGVVHSIEHLWVDNNWENQFRPELISGLLVKGKRYAVPFSVYTWGLFYKKSTIEKFGPVPEKWPEFLDYCHQIKNAGIAPFIATEEQPYIAAAWFEYLILRMHGLDLFNQVIKGELTYFDERIQSVFIEWKSMIDQDLFTTDYYDLSWEQYLPYFLRNKIGFLFLGTPIISRVFSDDIKKKIEFMPFPKIANIKRYETAPSDVFFITKKSKNKQNAEKLIAYLAGSKVQSHLAKYLYASPANKNSVGRLNELTAVAHESMSSASGWSPFIDRGSVPQFEREAVKIFARLFKDPDIAAMTKELEYLRLAFYKDAL